MLNLLFIYNFRLNIIRAVKPFIKELIGWKTKSPATNTNVAYYSAFDMHVEGRYHHEQSFKRLPVKFKNQVREQVWYWSKNSAGILIKFRTNSTSIWARWEILQEAVLNNMNRIGMGGLDLYCYQDGSWQYVNSAIGSQKVNERLLISNMTPGYKDFMLYFPIYDEVVKMEIGIEDSSEILAPSKELIATGDPILFYGTSITQGEGASRPGMTYTSIISRDLNVECINFGFSGNGMFEESVGRIICEVPARLIVLDCTPNSSPDTIRKNALNLITQLRVCHPDVPILVMESIMRENAYFNLTNYNLPGTYHYILAQNEELRRAYDAAEESGIQGLYYLSEAELTGKDHDGSVDGVHFSDLGQLRLAKVVETKISEILAKNNQ